MANGPSLSNLLSPKSQFGQAGRQSMQTAGNPGQQGQPMGPPATAPQTFAPMQGAPPVQAGVPGQGGLAAQLGAPQPGVASIPGMPNEMPADIATVLSQTLPLMTPEQIDFVASQIPDPTDQQEFIQLAMSVNPTYAQAKGAGGGIPGQQIAGVAGPQMGAPGPGLTGMVTPEQEFANVGGALGGGQPITPGGVGGAGVAA